MLGVHEPASAGRPLGDEPPLTWLFARQQPPNIMIDCLVTQIDEVAIALLHWCRLPISYHRLPGRMDLPDVTTGTLLLADAGVLTRDQAQALDHWLDRHGDGITVVSVTSVPSEQILNGCEWPLRLLYRLNMIRLSAADVLAVPPDDGIAAADEMRDR